MTIHKGGVISKNHKNDELYTPQELSNQIAEFYCDDLKKYDYVLMPFNSKGSQLQKALINKDVKVIATDLDFFDIDLSKFKNTVVFDNPPFSIFGKILKHIDNYKLPYYLFGPSMSLFHHLKREYVTGFNQLGRILFDNSETKVNVGIYTNCDFYLRNTFNLVKKPKVVKLKNERYSSGKIVPRLENGQVFDSRDFTEYSGKEFGGSMQYKGEIMTEEVTVIEEILPKVTFEPAKFEIENWEFVKSHIEEIINKNDNLVVTEETEKVSDDERKELDKLINAMSRARIDAKNNMLANFTPKEQALMALEGRMKTASDNIKQQVKSFKDKRAADEAREKAKKVTEIIDEVVNETEIIPERIIWDQKWTKNATFKSIRANVEEQVENLKAYDSAIQAQKDVINIASEALDLEPDGYIAMIGTSSIAEINDVMKKAHDRKINRAEIERQAEEAKRVAEQGIIEDDVIDPTELQREADLEKAQQIIEDKYNEDVPVDKPVDIVDNSKKDEAPKTKVKYIKYPEITGEQWRALLAFNKEHGIKIQVVEPAK